MSDQPHISDNAPSGLPDQRPPSAPAPHSGGQPNPGGQTDQPDPVDPAALEDYAEFQAWKRAKAEREEITLVATGGPAALDIDTLKLEIPDGDTIHTFEIANLDKDVLAHLQVLATFADTDMDRAAAIFEALLGPVEYERLRKTVRPMFRRIALAHSQDPEANPSIADVWTGMAEAVAKPIQELASDPKRIDSLRGASATGDESRSTSPASALPPAT